MSLFKKTSISLLLLFSSILFISAQEEALYSGKISPYTAYLLSSVNEMPDDSILVKESEKKLGIKRQDGQQYINAYIEFSEKNKGKILDFLKENNIEVHSIIRNILTAKIPVSSIEKISLNSDIERIEVGIPVLPQMNRARPASKVDSIQSESGLELTYKGKDVIIGIIDGGFEYGHPAFYTPDLSELRVKRVWNQNIKDDSDVPVVYNYGKEYTNTQDILAAQYDFMSDTHGTHVAGIATGADYSNNNVYYGIAPESDLVFVSYNKSDGTIDNVSITDAIKYIYDYADKVNKPCVINMSLGTHIGPHDGSSTFDQLCDYMQGKGKLLVGAVGNEGNEKIHISNQFTPQNNLLKTFISFRNQSRNYGYSDIWSEPGKTFSVQVVIYNNQTKEEVYATDILPTHVYQIRDYRVSQYEGHGATGRIEIYTEKNNKNNKSNALVFVNLNSINHNHFVGLKITANDGSVHAWADNSYSYFSNYNLNEWTDGNSDYSAGEIGGTGNRIISVGAYTTNSQFFNQPINDIATFSSKGPTADGRLKPEITAPGSSIVSSYSSYAVEQGEYASRVIKKSNIGGKDYYYGYMQGTSMSAPYVTGVLATWLEAKNNLSPEEAKYIMKRTAMNDSYTGDTSTDGNFLWGYGKLDAYNGLKECIRLQETESNNSDKKLIIYQTLSDPYLYIMFPNDDENLHLVISNSGGRIVHSSRIKKVKTYDSYLNPTIIDLSKFQSGLYSIRVIGKNKSYKPEKFIVNN